MSYKIFYERINSLSNGSTNVTYNNSKYLLTKETLQENKVIKIYAKELSGNDFISFNIYKTSTGNNLKPCEMPAKKVVDFILGFNL